MAQRCSPSRRQQAGRFESSSARSAGAISEKPNTASSKPAMILRTTALCALVKVHVKPLQTRRSKTGGAGTDKPYVAGSRCNQMFAIIGALVVLGAVMGGYLMEHGKIGVLLQPAELLIIAGAAAGTLLIANPIQTIVKIAKGLVGVLKGSPYTKAHYLETLKMLSDLFVLARKGGMVRLEGDIEDPEKSPVFTKYPAFLAN